MKKRLSRREFIRLSAGSAAGIVLAACAPQQTLQTTGAEGEGMADAPAPETTTLTFLALHSQWPDVLPMFYEDHPDIVVEPDILGWDAFFEQIQPLL